MQNKRQVMAAIINDGRTDRKDKAEQLFSLLLHDSVLIEKQKIVKAIAWMIKEYDQEICRHSDFPLITHPLSVMHFTALYAPDYDCLNTNTILASLGHDLLDDSKKSDHQVIDEFGIVAEKIISSLTDYNKKFIGYGKQPSVDTWRTRKALYLRGLRDRLNQPWSKQMLVIAGADKLDNTQRITLEALHINSLPRRDRKNIWGTPTKDLQWYYDTFLALLDKELGGRLSIDLKQSYEQMIVPLAKII